MVRLFHPKELADLGGDALFALPAAPVPPAPRRPTDPEPARPDARPGPTPTEPIPVILRLPARKPDKRTF